MTDSGYAQRPERLWLVGMPSPELERDAEAWSEAEKVNGALADAFTVAGHSDARSWRCSTRG